MQEDLPPLESWQILHPAHLNLHGRPAISAFAPHDLGDLKVSWYNGLLSFRDIRLECSHSFSTMSPGVYFWIDRQ